MSVAANAEAEPHWLTIARGEIGVHERAGAEDNPRVLEYLRTVDDDRHGDEEAWCSAFLEWVFRQDGQTGPCSKAARGWLHWGTSLSAPRVGCVVVLSRPPATWTGHVGLYLSQHPTQFTLLSGNSANAVRIARYDKSRLLDYRWPPARPLTTPK